jgi:hypothetical protein
LRLGWFSQGTQGCPRSSANPGLVARTPLAFGGNGADVAISVGAMGQSHGYDRWPPPFWVHPMGRSYVFQPESPVRSRVTTGEGVLSPRWGWVSFRDGTRAHARVYCLSRLRRWGVIPGTCSGAGHACCGDVRAPDAFASPIPKTYLRGSGRSSTLAVRGRWWAALSWLGFGLCGRRPRALPWAGLVCPVEARWGRDFWVRPMGRSDVYRPEDPVRLRVTTGEGVLSPRWGWVPS